jgi:hypothetical protein
MNSDPSNNPIHRRSGGGGGGNGDRDDRNRNDYYDRFHLNQYYNAVEDEQIYMDEYTTLLHRYNEFIVNGNAMFNRMEQTLRENLARTQVRQYFYYQQSENIRNARTIRRNDVAQQPSVPSPRPTAPVPAAAPAAPAAAPTSTAGRFNEIFPRLLSRYLTTEMEREAREQLSPPAQRDVFSMLYTVPIAVRTNAGGGGIAGGGAAAAAAAASAAGAPTIDQINRATLNTLFSRIITPVNATCPISRDEFNDESEITMIRGCNHIFNRASLSEWFVSHSTCPMCRSDIREYRAPRQEQPILSQGPQHNISIDRVDENELTFSYDIPLQYNNNQIYQDIVNTITGMTQTIHQNRNNNDDNNNDDDDIMEVD